MTSGSPTYITQNTHGPDPNRLDAMWQVMYGERGDLESRSEDYARWTLPYICPENGQELNELAKSEVVIGPRLVNHLANKIVDTMFPHDRPFFALTLTPDARKKLREEFGDEGEASFADAIRSDTANIEEIATRKMQLTLYRPQAVEAVKHLIITGNVVIKRLPDGRRVIYGIKDFAVRRRVDGQAYHIMLRDSKLFGGLPKVIREALQAKKLKHYDDHTPCVLYTEYKFDGKRWAMRQAVDDCMLNVSQKYTPEDMPVLCMTWTLARGSNYGRGLVEDHVTGFHQIDVLTRAAVDMAGIMADIKFLVDPASGLDVTTLNNSPRGSYHAGREGDISTPTQQRSLDIATVKDLITANERELSQAFLLNSSTVRDAERVTAEEIRYIAQELEGAFGGLYSRLALEWQKYEAEFAIRQIDFRTELPNSKIKAFEVVITTGLESLSREGQLENLRRAIADLQMLDAVPEEVRATINPAKFRSFVFTNHAVKFKEFEYTEEEITANNKAAMDREQALINMQTNGKLQEQAGAAAVQESQ